MRIKTFSSSSTRKLDSRVNEFLQRADISVRAIHASMSFGTYMVVVQYDERWT